MIVIYFRIGSSSRHPLALERLRLLPPLPSCLPQTSFVQERRPVDHRGLSAPSTADLDQYIAVVGYTVLAELRARLKGCKHCSDFVL